jgi:hypothetical protein
MRSISLKKEEGTMHTEAAKEDKTPVATRRFGNYEFEQALWPEAYLMALWARVS